MYRIYFFRNQQPLHLAKAVRYLAVPLSFLVSANAALRLIMLNPFLRIVNTVSSQMPQQFCPRNPVVVG